MQNPLHNIQRRRRIQSILLSLVGLFILWLVFPLLSKGVFFALSPFWKAEDRIQTSFVHSIELIIDSKQTLIRDKRKLETELEGLRADVQRLRVENARFAFFDSLLPQELPGTLEVTLIYSKPPTSPYDTFLVNKGGSDGLEVGNTLYVSENSVVGVVEKSFRDHSLVRLFSYPGMETEVVLSNGAEVTLRGEGAYSFSVEVPLDSGIEVGSIVRQASQALPVIGFVRAIEVDEVEGLKTLFVRPPVNLSTQEFLLFYPGS